MLKSFQQDKPILEYQSVFIKWCPWLIDSPGIATLNLSPGLHESSLLAFQNLFTQHLKSFSGVETALLNIKQQAPQLYTDYQKLADGFEEVFLLKVNLLQLELICQSSPPAGQIESCKAFQALIDWRKHVEQKEYNSALEALKPQHFPDWHIIQHAHTVTKKWTDEILPWLKLISNFNFSSGNSLQQHLPQSLTDISLASNEICFAWKRIVDQRLSILTLENFEKSIETAKTLFSAWVDLVKKKDDPVSQLLYLQNAELFHQVLENFLSLHEFCGLLKIDILALEGRDDVTMTMKIQAGKNIFGHLYEVEQILVSDPQEQIVPDWHQAYARLHETKFPKEGLEMVPSLPDSHPLFTGLMQLIFTD
jgi:hypothetical protein